MLYFCAGKQIFKILTVVVSKFVYVGISKNLEKVDISSLSEVVLNFNVDGLSPFKSSPLVFWPILCSIGECSLAIIFVLSYALLFQTAGNLPQGKVFPVAVYQGNSKPALEPFLAQFVTELKMLCEVGVEVGGKHFIVRIGYFVCDNPAKSFIKHVVQFNAYRACDKCEVKGVYEKGRMTFRCISASNRTDESFRYVSD